VTFRNIRALQFVIRTIGKYCGGVLICCFEA
jgi:hypothetical protein